LYLVKLPLPYLNILESVSRAFDYCSGLLPLNIANLQIWWIPFGISQPIFAYTIWTFASKQFLGGQSGLIMVLKRIFGIQTI
jgi:hypothetical protein